MKNLTAEQKDFIHQSIIVQAGRPKEGAICLACNDLGYVLSPSEIVGKYPKGTPLSQMIITEPNLQECLCCNNPFGW